MNPRYERWRWITFGITWLIYASVYFTRNAFAVAKIGLEGDSRVSMSREDYGKIDSVYSMTYLIGQFLFGMLGDRFGPRRVLLPGLALSVIAAVASGFSTAFTAFCFFAILQGIAQSTAWPTVNKTMGAWFSLRERGRVLGMWCTHYTIGYAIALPFAGWMMEVFGTPTTIDGKANVIPYWPAAFWGTAAVVGVVCTLAWLLLRNRPEDIGLPSIEQYHGERESLIENESPNVPPPASSWQVVGEVLSSPTIWMLAISYFSIKLVRYTFIFWGPKYVSESLGTNAYWSTMTNAAMPIGGALGVIASGYLSDKFFQSRRAPVIVLSLLITAALMFVGLYKLPGIVAMAAFFFLIGFFLFIPDSMISSTASVDFGTKRGAGTATGVVNCIGSFGSVLSGYLPGKITTDGDWTPLFIVFQAGLIGSALILAPLWRAKPPQR